MVAALAKAEAQALERREQEAELKEKGSLIIVPSSALESETRNMAPPSCVN